MKRLIVKGIAGYADACERLYEATHSNFQRGQMLGYINALEAIGGRHAKKLQDKLNHTYNGWIDEMNKEADK